MILVLIWYGFVMLALGIMGLVVLDDVLTTYIKAKFGVEKKC